MTVLLRGGRVLDPGAGIDMTADVLVRDGKVAGIGPNLAAEPDGDTIECSGFVITPGFIDLHCHLRDPGQTHKSLIRSGTRAAAAGGFTTVCCMPNTDPVIDSAATVEYVLRTARTDATVRVLPIGAVTKGQEGKELAELEELAAAGCVAYSDDGHPVATAALMRRALEYSRLTGLPVIDHCEEPSLVKGAVANEGAVSSRLGLRGWPAAAEEIAIARDLILLLELAGGRLHIAHISTAGGVALLRQAKAKGLPVTAEVAPHHLTLTDDWLLGERLVWPATGSDRLPDRMPYDTRTRVNPPLRAKRDVEAVIGGLADGTIDAIATDHAPHALVDKLCEFDRAANGISGLETALAALLSLVDLGQIGLPRVVQALTAGPIRTLGLPLGDHAGASASAAVKRGTTASPGTLRVGSIADLTVFDPKETWTVDPDAFFSKGKNSPIDGLTLRGKVKLTLVDGAVVHRG